MIFFVLIIGWIASAFFCASVASEKGYSGASWGIAGLLFGFFALTGKATSFIGPLLFGIVNSIYNQQVALWIVVVFFLIGFVLFRKIDFDLLNSRNEM